MTTLELAVLALSILVTAIGMSLYTHHRSGARAETRGDDIFQDVWVEQAQIERGEIISFPDPRGGEAPLQVRLPTEASHGWALRLVGKGVGGRGDLYVRLKVRRPDRRV